MRLAFISTMHGWSWGGSEELWSQTAIQLQKMGHKIYASVGYWPQLSPKVTALATHGITLDIHPSSNGGQAQRVWGKFSRGEERSYSRLKRFSPDLVVISQGHNSGGFGWARFCREAGIPYVIIVQCNSEQWWFDERSVAEAAECYAGARKVFCVSGRNLELLRLQVGEPLLNAEVARNPYNVSPDQLPKWPDEGQTLKLACVARMDLAAKGQDLLLQVLARPEWRDRPIELNLFGSGGDELALRRMAAMLRLNNMRLHGHVNDIEAIWAQNHMLVLPSRYEGLPLALVEAMWCARSAIVTDAGGNAELCLDGQTGFVAPAPQVSLFANAMERAWERRKEWQRMGEAARLRVENEIPKDPIGVFSEKLIGSVTANSSAK